jgi:hypothetical protein
MPCYVEETPEERREAFYRSFEHNSPVAEMLCTMCKAYISVTPSALPAGVVKWWREHQRRDKAKREAESRAKGVKLDRKRALAKLTLAERKALGL